CMQGMQLPFTF
nr:immunoglobulin light chain junction region [Macaca mulatta]